MKALFKNKNRMFFLCSVSMCALFFYRCIWKLGLHSIDDWNTVNENVQGWNNAYTGIINSIVSPQRHLFADTITRLINYCQISPGSIVIYRVFTLLAIILAVYSMYVFLKLLINSDFAAETVLIFTFGAQIFDLNYNGFISFSCVYQAQIAMAFLCLIFHVNYYSSFEKKYLIWESVLYFTACCFYESFVFICFPILAITLSKRSHSGTLTLKNLIKDLWIPSIGAIVFFSVYFFFYFSDASFSYSGTQVGSSTKISEVLITLANLSFSNFPGYLTFTDGSRAFNYIISHIFRSPILYGFIFVIAVCGGIAFAILQFRRKSIKTGSLLFLIATSMVTAVLIALPLALTSHYIGGVCSGMLVNYGVSYYCWYFVSIAVCGLLQLVSQRINSNFSIILAAVIFTFVSFFTLSSNDYYQKSRNEKFYSAETVARSDLFLSDDRTTDIYLMGFNQIYGDENNIVSKINKCAGTDFSAVFSTGPYYQECTPNSAFIRRFPGSNHGEIVAAYLDDNYQSDTVIVYIPQYDGTQQLKIEYGPEFSMSAIFPLDGSLGNHVVSSEIIDSDFGGRIIRLVLDMKFDYRFALSFSAKQR